MSGFPPAALVTVCGYRHSVTAGLEPENGCSHPASLDHVPLPALESQSDLDWSCAVSQGSPCLSRGITRPDAFHKGQMRI